MENVTGKCYCLLRVEHKHAFKLVYLITKYFLKLFLVVTNVHCAWTTLNAAKYRDIDFLNNKIKGIRDKGQKKSQTTATPTGV